MVRPHEPSIKPNRASPQSAHAKIHKLFKKRAQKRLPKEISEWKHSELSYEASPEWVQF